MSKYTITHACGHVKIHQIYGTDSKGERGRKAEWLSRCICEDCYKAEQEAKRAVENAQNAEKNAESGFPALTGTEKQVAWAETIRANQAKELLDFLGQFEENAHLAPKEAEIGKELITQLLQRSSAAEWIDSRDVRYDRWLMSEIEARL